MTITTTTYEIEGTCFIECVAIEGYPNDVSINYTEHSSDNYYPDHETYHTIDKDTAIAMIAFMKEAHGIVDETVYSAGDMISAWGCIATIDSVCYDTKTIVTKHVEVGTIKFDEVDEHYKKVSK